MKPFHLIPISLFLILASCEKPVYDPEEDNEEKKENPANRDNGGWTDSNGSSEWFVGDTISVADFKANAYSGAVWVKGYIVGCGSTTGGYKFTFSSPFDSNTSILIADDKNESEKKNIIPVQLKKGSEMRNELNLVDNPQNAGKQIAVYGFQTSYMKMKGIKDAISYEFK